MMIANCGYPDRSEFQAISHWFERVALKMHMGITGEIYATQGKLLTAPTGELQAAIADYLRHLEIAGQEIAIHGQLSAATATLLERVFVTP